MEVAVSWATILKIAAACLLGYCAFLLWRFEELLLVAAIIAIACRPMVSWIARHHWPKWTGALFSALIMLALTALAFGVLIPTVSDQAVALVKKLPQLKEEITQRLPKSGPLGSLSGEIFGSQSFSDPQPLLKKVFALGGAALEHVMEYFVVLILAVYFVADGERIYKWFRAFLPQGQRGKLDQTADDVTSVVGRYVVGNLMTSALAAVYAFVVLQLLHVPNAALLAVLAGVFDLLPLIGFFLFAIPAVLLALTVSPTAALLVGLLYGAYHLAENYFIVPKVYGNRLRLSTLTVLIACLAGAILAGVIGVIIALPLAACYPIVERIWLRPCLEVDTVAKHERLDEG